MRSPIRRRLTAVAATALVAGALVACETSPAPAESIDFDSIAPLPSQLPSELPTESPGESPTESPSGSPSS